MSNQHARPYKPTPRKMAENTREELERAAERSISVRVLLDHIAWLESRYRGIGQALLNETGSVVSLRHFNDEHPTLLAYAQEYAADLRSRIQHEERRPPPVLMVAGDGEIVISKDSPSFPPSNKEEGAC